MTMISENIKGDSRRLLYVKIHLDVFLFNLMSPGLSFPKALQA